MPLGEQDVYLFREGTHASLQSIMGCMLDVQSATFRVWAPNAARVSVIGEWNGWDAGAHPLEGRQDGTGIWEGGVRGVVRGQAYKYRIVTRDGVALDKADPFALYAEIPPATASRAWTLDYDWHDAAWMASRHAAMRSTRRCRSTRCISGRGDATTPTRSRPIGTSRNRSPITCARMGFTHVELMPLTEHPFYGSWGYQTTGYFAPTARYGAPQDFMYLVDHLHQRGIGVILDWVPSHFPDDPHGLARLRRHAPLRARRPAAGLSSGVEQLHLQLRPPRGARVPPVERALLARQATTSTACASMPSRRCCTSTTRRKEGEWIPNVHGGRENLGRGRSSCGS